ncbi:class I SAM-dependent methyltransferase [Microlunatus endophyticus]
MFLPARSANTDRGQPFDLTFIDGLHLFEFALRDFINAERHSSNRGVIIFDDMLPRSVDEAARVRHTNGWTGDVYSMLGVFAKYRPELSVITVDTRPTGLLMITGLDPANTVLRDHYDQILQEFRHADPQRVPERLLDRLGVAAPHRVLDSGLLELIAGTDPTTHPDELRPQISGLVESRLGQAFAPAAVSRG